MGQWQRMVSRRSCLDKANFLSIFRHLLAENGTIKPIPCPFGGIKAFSSSCRLPVIQDIGSSKHPSMLYLTQYLYN
jgi:hypothetical protein